jgi:hypothetical protein
MKSNFGEILSLFIHANHYMKRSRDYGFLVYALAHFMDQHKAEHDFSSHTVYQWIRENCTKSEAACETPFFVNLINHLDLKQTEKDDYSNLMTNVINERSYLKPSLIDRRLKLIREEIPMIIKHVEEKYRVEKCLQYDKTERKFKWVPIQFKSPDFSADTQGNAISILPVDFIVIHEMIDHRVIHADGSIVVKKTRRIQALRDEINDMTFRYNPETDPRGTSYSDFTLKITEVNAILHPRTVECRVDINNPETILYKIFFKPHLTEGHQIQFTTEETFRGLHIMSFEELEELDRKGAIHLCNLEERSTTRIAYPMKTLHRTICFDPGYMIQDARCNAAMQRKTIHEESVRIKKNFHFTPATKKTGAKIELLVEHPIRDMQYEIYWTPPRKKTKK